MLQADGLSVRLGKLSYWYCSHFVPPMPYPGTYKPSQDMQFALSMLVLRVIGCLQASYLTGLMLGTPHRLCPGWPAMKLYFQALYCPETPLMASMPAASRVNVILLHQ